MKSIDSRRLAVMFIAELMASNFFAFRPGIRPSNEVSTQLHLAAMRSQTALPTSMSKPTSWPSACLLSNGG
ncbi:hypothetical protein D3C71_2181790 [compost metagenome]